MIKVTTNNTCAKSELYPKLMRAKTSKLVVLFCANMCGMVIVPNHNYTVGHYADNWGMCSFEDYNEPITLQNE